MTDVPRDAKGRILPGHSLNPSTKFKKGNEGGRMKMKNWKPSQEQMDAVILAVAGGMNVMDARKLVVNPRTGKAVSLDTIRAHFGDRLDEAVAERRMRLQEKAFAIAMNDDHPRHDSMLKFLLRDFVPVGSTKITVNQQGGPGQSGPVLIIGVQGQPNPEGVSEDDFIDGELDE